MITFIIILSSSSWEYNWQNCPNKYEPEGGACFQHKMSLKAITATTAGQGTLRGNVDYHGHAEHLTPTQMQQFLEAGATLSFAGTGRKPVYALNERTLRGCQYPALSKKDKGIVRG